MKGSIPAEEQEVREAREKSSGRRGGSSLAEMGWGPLLPALRSLLLVVVLGQVGQGLELSHEGLALRKRKKELPVVCVCVCVRAQSCPTHCDPMDCSPSGSSVHGTLQARILEWVAISSSRRSSRPRDRTCVSCIGRRIRYHCATWEALGVLFWSFMMFNNSANSFKV